MERWDGDERYHRFDLVSLIPPGDVRSVWLFEFKLLAGCAVLILMARVMFAVALRRRKLAAQV